MRKLIDNCSLLIGNCLLALLLTVTSYQLTVVPAYAQRDASSSTREQTRITQIKQRANMEIQRRVSSLNNLITRINNIKKLSSDNKATLTSQIQAQISSLTTLQAKIDADTDLATLKADVKSIIDSYRIYALFIPKTHILIASDTLLQVVDKFTDLQTKLQARVDAAKAAGKDTSSLKASLTDMQSKVADAKSQINQAVSLVTPLQPGPDPQTFMPTLKQAREMLRTARHDLDDGRHDARTIIQGLKQLGFSSATSSAIQKQ